MAPAVDRLRAALVGEPVTAVCFVMDYVEIQADRQVLRALTDPEVRSGTDIVRFPAAEAVARLHKLIGQTFVDVFQSDDHIAFTFDQGMEVRLTRGQSLDRETLQLSETGQPSLVI